MPHARCRDRLWWVIAILRSSIEQLINGKNVFRALILFDCISDGVFIKHAEKFVAGLVKHLFECANGCYGAGLVVDTETFHDIEIGLHSAHDFTHGNHFRGSSQPHTTMFATGGLNKVFS